MSYKKGGVLGYRAWQAEPFGDDGYGNKFVRDTVVYAFTFLYFPYVKDISKNWKKKTKHTNIRTEKLPHAVAGAKAFNLYQ